MNDREAILVRQSEHEIAAPTPCQVNRKRWDVKDWLTCAKPDMKIQQNLELKIHTIHKKQPCILYVVMLWQEKIQIENAVCMTLVYSPNDPGLWRSGGVSGFRQWNCLGF